MNVDNLKRVMNDLGLDENDAIGLIKDGIQKRKEREAMRVREKERRDFAKYAVEQLRKAQEAAANEQKRTA